ncbi:S-Ena type endospore appendage [Bacillus sp. 165]|uniref:S-Ena type endospore appendage n=1 Tax=Bacillus sp. 165 TaxID=1529117 RepID=UPI001ADB5D84|nr:S-Ena type endospore appendage [Bacillus sp. 165]MBO9130578.1 hypothetical protein [Bacillus sp. 165]
MSCKKPICPIAFPVFDSHCVPCPPRPVNPTKTRKCFENCVPFRVVGNQKGSTIFTAGTSTFPNTIAATVENTSDFLINVIVSFEVGQQTIGIQPHSSLSFVFDDVTQINVFGSNQSGFSDGIFKFDVCYTFEV